MKAKIKCEFSATKAEIQGKLEPLTIDQKLKNSQYLCLEDASWKFFKVKINLLLITRVIFGPFKITMSHWDNSYTIKFKTSVVTQFWIHQDFLECYFISIIIYKNIKIKKKFKIKKNNKKNK